MSNSWRSSGGVNDNISNDNSIGGNKTSLVTTGYLCKCYNCENEGHMRKYCSEIMKKGIIQREVQQMEWNQAKKGQLLGDWRECSQKAA